MKRDMELCRKILFRIEEDTSGRPISDLKIEGYSAEDINYNCKLLYQEGFVEDYTPYFRSQYSVGQLTWEGHDFLDKVREETVWNRIKEAVAQKGATLTFEIIKSVAPSIISSMITGI